MTGSDRGTIFAGRNLYLLLHEMMHMVTQKNDEDLAHDLGITKGPNEGWSAAVSRCFNSHCLVKSP